jgi:Alpha/beta hydrolase of unknown function (DUF900)
MKTLAEIVSQLEAAVRARDRARAIPLARQIEQSLVQENHEQAAIERRVRALMAELNQPGPRPLPLDQLLSKVERGASEPKPGGVVFPVWFGTNRKPHSRGNGFASDRHDRVAHGRVEVYVPEAWPRARTVRRRRHCSSCTDATAFFSWPSRGSVTAYPADEASIEGSEQAITDFLVDFTQNCGAEKVHVIAHSMGNRGRLRALQRIAANAGAGEVKFDQVLLAAPDVDRDLFLNLAATEPRHLYGNAFRPQWTEAPPFGN